MKLLVPVVLVLAVAVAARAADPPKSKATQAEQLAALQKQHKDAEKAFQAETAALPETPEGRKKATELYQAFDKGQAERFLAAVELAKRDPKSDDALAALEWVLTVPRSYYLPAGKTAIELVAANYAKNPKVGKILAWLGYYRPRGGDAEAATMALLEAAAKSNPDRTARGQAVMALAWVANEKFAVAEHRSAPDAEKLGAEAEKAFELVRKDYGDVPRLIREGTGTLGQRADTELFALRHLRVGKEAPNIKGEDLDGVKFELADYRGKVVVLDFWGDW
jgi:hypothetical protein